MSNENLTLETRSSGILHHLTSLPGPYGYGDLGPEIDHFIQFLSETNQSWWQMLPIGPPGVGDSPYNTFSTFAGNPNFIDLRDLRIKGWLDEIDIKPEFNFGHDFVPFYEVWNYKEPRLRKAHKNFSKDKKSVLYENYAKFIDSHGYWLNDYADYMAIKRAHGQAAWFQWEPEIRLRKKEALEKARSQLQGEIDFFKFLQFVFDYQWTNLRKNAHAAKIKLIGDLPFYVATDSAEVWAHPELFCLKDDGQPAFVAGVPPDYFSETGQLWGNVLYRWDVLKEQNYDWWIDRLKKSFALFDVVRLDHFLGFQKFWEIPADAKTAKEGWYKEGPGASFFAKAKEKLGALPIIAEDLGNVTPEMESIRDQFHFPGMRVLQFAFDGGKNNPHLSYRFNKNSIVYTGTHDNDTTVGWFRNLNPNSQNGNYNSIQKFTLDYLGSDGKEINWDMMRLAMSSVSNICITPMQDVLGLGSQARMNQPGTGEGNWAWRFKFEELTEDAKNRLKNMTALYGRNRA